MRRSGTNGRASRVLADRVPVGGLPSFAPPWLPVFSPPLTSPVLLALAAALAPAMAQQDLVAGSAAVELPFAGSARVLGAEVTWRGASAVVRRGNRVVTLPENSPWLRLRSGVFDPTVGEPDQAPLLRARHGQRLHVVQFATRVVPEYRAALVDLGLAVRGYLPDSAYLVDGDEAGLERARRLAFVRWVGAFAPGHRLEPALAIAATSPETAATSFDCHVVLADKALRTRAAFAVEELGARVVAARDGSTYLEATLRGDQLAAIAALDEVLWIDRATPVETDMNLARIQGGANAVEFAAGLTGQGLRVQVLEGLQQSHRDWTLPVLVQFDSQEAHGHCTGMIVAGNGSGNTNARGLLPDAQVIESSVFAWGASSRWTVTQAAVDPNGPFRAMQSTASWGNTASLDYTSVSAELDDVLFDHDLPTTQSQSNLGTRFSRPQAWAKNVISVGGIFHRGTESPLDDVWDGGGSLPASIGPAADGRIKPDLIGYYDGVQCGDLMGAEGYTPTDYASSFGGTSAATPMVNGFLGLAQQMFTDGAFGNALPLPPTAANRFANRPHMATAKALLCSTAASYAFTGADHDLARTHQGWGFPAVDALWSVRQKLLVVDESELLQQGQSRTWFVHVAPGTPEFRATLAWSDPAALPNALVHRVNDLDLKVRRFQDGVEWWGNHGLDVGNGSVPGGARDDRNTLEQVWLPNPQPGIYLVTVSAPQIAQDGHVETPQVDADFALVVHPMGGGYRVPTATTVELQSNGPGDLRIAAAGVPAAGWTEGFTFVSTDTARPVGFGDFFGLQYDAFTDAALGTPLQVGDPFHFANAGAEFFPFVPWTVPPPVALSLRGVKFDLTLMLFDALGRVVDVAGVTRSVVP